MEAVIGAGCGAGPVRDTDQRHAETPQICVDLRLPRNIEMGGAFIEEQQFRLSIEGAGKQHALLLPARQRAPHVADQAIIGHRHRHDLVVNPGDLGAFDHPVLVIDCVEKADVVGDRARQQLIFLHDRADIFPIGTRAHRRQRNPVNQHIARGRLQQPEHDLDESRLAPARWAADRDKAAGFDEEVYVFEYERLRLGIAEPHIAQFDAAYDRSGVSDGAVMPRFRRAQRDVGQALDMQFEYAEIDRRLDQRHRFRHETLLVGHDGEDHADRELAAQRHAHREVDSHDVFEPEDRFVERGEEDLCAADADRGIDDAGIAVQPLAFPLGFAVEELEALDCPQRLDQRRIFLRLAADHGFAALAELPVQRQSQDQVEQKGGDYHAAEHRAVQEHDRERHDPH
jgi:hypothetical protein